METEKALKDWRKELSMTRKDLAAEVGCTSHYIYLVESGRRSPSPIVKKAIESAISEAAKKKVVIF